MARAALIASEATGEERFLELVLHTTPHVLGLRDSETKRVDVFRSTIVPSWGTAGFADVEGWTNGVSLAGRICFPILEAVRQVRAKPSRVERHGKLGGWVKACEKALSAFDAEWHDVDAEPPYGYWRRATKGDIEPTNHMLSVAEALVNHGLLSDNPKPSQRRVRRLVSYFKRHLVKEKGGTYRWARQVSLQGELPPDRPTEWTWKAQVSAAFAVTAHRHELAFSETDMKRFANTFERNVHRGDLEFSDRIDRGKHRRIDRVGSRPGKLYRLFGWMVLEAHGTEIRIVLEDAMAERKELFPDGWLTHPSSMVGYAQRLHPAPKAKGRKVSIK